MAARASSEPLCRGSEAISSGCMSRGAAPFSPAAGAQVRPVSRACVSEAGGAIIARRGCHQYLRAALSWEVLEGGAGGVTDRRRRGGPQGCVGWEGPAEVCCKGVYVLLRRGKGMGRLRRRGRMGKDEEDVEVLEGGLWAGNGRSGSLIQVFSVRFTLVIVKVMFVFMWL